MAGGGRGLASARLVSTVAALGVAGVLGLAAQRISGRSLAGLLAAGFFLTSPYLFHTAPLARVNSLAFLAAGGGPGPPRQAPRPRGILRRPALVPRPFPQPPGVGGP